MNEQRLNDQERSLIEILDWWPECDDEGTTLAQIQHFVAWCLSDRFEEAKLIAVKRLVDRFMARDDYDFAIALYDLIGYPEGVEAPESEKEEVK